MAEGEQVPSGGESGAGSEKMGPEETRALSDAELIKDGARYEESNHSQVLTLTDGQVETIKDEHDKTVLKNIRETFVKSHSITEDDLKALETVSRRSITQGMSRPWILARFADSDVKKEYSKDYQGRVGFLRYYFSQELGRVIAEIIITQTLFSRIDIKHTIFEKDQKGNYSHKSYAFSLPKDQMNTMGWYRRARE